MRVLVLLACFTVASADNATFCGAVANKLPKECECQDKTKGGVASCQVKVMNDTIGMEVEIEPCDTIAHISLLITESQHGISFPVKNIQAGDIQEVPIPHLSVAIPGYGTVGLDASGSIDGNPDHLTVKAGFNACGDIKGHKVCGDQFIKFLPFWVLHHTFELGDFCKSMQKHLDVIV